MVDNPNSTEMSVGRLEAFSDGVFGVAVTLLVLNIQLPHLSESAGVDVLITALVSLWPAYLSYFITFVSIGALWISHHQLLKYFQRVDVPVQLANIIFLMLVALTPFTTVLLADSITITARLRVALVISGTVWTAMGLLMRSIERYSMRVHLLKPHSTSPNTTSLSRLAGLSTLVGIFATLIGLISPEIGVFIFFVIALRRLAPIVEVFRPAAFPMSPLKKP